MNNEAVELPALACGAGVAQTEDSIRVCQTFDEVLVKVAPELFSCLGIQSERTGAKPELKCATTIQLVSSLGFTGERLKGVMDLVCSPRCAIALRDAGLHGALQTDLGEAGLVDWVGELLNQFLGRIQNQLYRDGLEVQMATPTTVRGDALALVRKGGESQWHQYRFDGHELSVRVTLVFEPHYTWPPIEDDEQPISEGGLLMF